MPQDESSSSAGNVVVGGPNVACSSANRRERPAAKHATSRTVAKGSRRRAVGAGRLRAYVARGNSHEANTCRIAVRIRGAPRVAGDLGTIRRPIANPGGTGVPPLLRSKGGIQKRYREAILFQLNIYDHPLSTPNLRRLTREVRRRDIRPPTIPVGRPIHARIHAAAFSSSAGSDSATGSLKLAVGAEVALRAGAGCFRIPPRYAPVTFSLE